MRFAPLTALAFAALAFPAAAETPSYPAAEAQVLDLTKQAIALRSVRGEGNQTPQVAELFRQALLAGGWAESDIDIVPVDDTAYIVAAWPGSDPSLGPIVVSAHMDVVEAKPEDWERDPFTPVVEDGYLFGRGASDTKFDAVLAMSSLIDLRRSGFEPKRSIVIAYSGDEETTMKTSRAITDRLRDAALVLNVDGASGMFDDDTGRPLFWTWQGAEKTYVDFQLEVTNPGGHSSAPRPDNAIVDLSNALARIGAYRFKPELNDITRESLSKGADLVPDPELAAAMRAFAADPTDEEAISVLRADPGMTGQIGTTCVPTMVNGGHAENALPQRATAIVNCRIFPGHSIEEIMGELEQVAAEPKIEFSDFTGEDTIAAPASPLIPEYVAIFSRGIEKAWGEMPIFPAQSAGASDSMWYRAAGIPSYSVSPTFVRPKDEFSHGLNERVELRNIRPGITYYLSVFTDLASQ